MENTREAKVNHKKSKSEIIILIILLLACVVVYMFYQHSLNEKMHQDVSASEYVGTWGCVYFENVSIPYKEEGNETISNFSKYHLFKDGTFRRGDTDDFGYADENDIIEGRWSENEDGSVNILCNGDFRFPNITILGQFCVTTDIEKPQLL